MSAVEPNFNLSALDADDPQAWDSLISGFLASERRRIQAQLRRGSLGLYCSADDIINEAIIALRRQRPLAARLHCPLPVVLRKLFRQAISAFSRLHGLKIRRSSRRVERFGDQDPEQNGSSPDSHYAESDDLAEARRRLTEFADYCVQDSPSGPTLLLAERARLVGNLLARRMATDAALAESEALLPLAVAGPFALAWDGFQQEVRAGAAPDADLLAPYLGVKRDAFYQRVSRARNRIAYMHRNLVSWFPHWERAA